MNTYFSSPRRKLFWPSEAQVRSILEKIYYRVYAKVTLYDIVDPKFREVTGQYLFSAAEQNYIFNSAHADFVIVDNKDYPILIVEVDGDSHHTPKQKERDALKDSILKKANIPLVRLKVELLRKAQTQDYKLRTNTNLDLNNEPIQAMVLGTLSAMAHDPLIFECGKAVYRRLLAQSRTVDLWEWAISVMKANSVRSFEKKWPDQAEQHDTVEALLNLLIKSLDQQEDSIFSELEYIGHQDWLPRALALQQLDLIMVDRHIRKFIAANGSLGGDIAAWYLIKETAYYPEAQHLLPYCLQVQRVLQDFQFVLRELITVANERQEVNLPWISEWLRKRTITYEYQLPDGSKTSLYTFYGFDRPGGGGITPLYDYIIDHDLKYSLTDKTVMSRHDQYVLSLYSETLGWLPEYETVQESCNLVINIADETNFAIAFFIEKYRITVSRL